MGDIRIAKEALWDEITFGPQGLIPAIVQERATGQVLMMAWMNAESLQQTLDSGQTVFWSRSRKALWHKGATSGNVQEVIELRLDCDGDTLLVLVDSAGPACHTGERSCFFRVIDQESFSASDADADDDADVDS